MATSTQTRPGLYYGWIILLFLMIVPLVVYGVYFVGIGPSVGPLAQEFGWSRTYIVGAYSLAAGIGALIAPILGYVVDRVGPRLLLAVSAVALGLGAWAVSLEDGSGILWYAGWFGMVAIPQVWGGFPALQKVAATWFLRRRGLAIALIVCATAFIYSMAAVHGLLVEAYGWRMSWRIMGVAGLVVPILVSLLVVRNRPEEKGYHIDGVPMTAEEKEEWARYRGHPPSEAGAPKTQAVAEDSFTVWQALRTPALWLICTAGAAATMALNIQTTQQVPFLEAMGISKVVAGAVLGAMGLAGAPGRLGVGLLIDRFGTASARWWYVLALAIMVVGMLILTQARSVELVWVFVVIFGLGQGMSVSAPVTMLAFYFGPEPLSTMLSVRVAILQVGAIGGPLFAAWTFDTFGNYELAFIVTAVILALVAVLVIFAAPPKVPVGAARPMRPASSSS